MGKITRDRFVSGDHNAICDLSGQKYKRSDMRLTWDNLLVGKDKWSPKQPQLVIHPKQDSPAVTNQTRTEAADPAMIDASFDPSPSNPVLYAAVLDSDGNSFTVNSVVEDNVGSIFKVIAGVLDSDENSFTVFV
jgi:hypothetical protein